METDFLEAEKQQASYRNILARQNQFFSSGATLPLAFRLAQLKKLMSLLLAHENDITAALHADLNKSPTEVFVTEFSQAINELRHTIKQLPGWMKAKKVSTPFPSLWPGRSRIYHDPYGTVLLISPWNFPLLLLINPLIGAMAAGNCVIIKPSEMAPNTQALLARLINENFPAEYLTAVSATADQMQYLLAEKFDYIFFTGSTAIGKIIMQAAAKHLTPLTLELGGKCPCIVDESANIVFAARRIAWAKTVNAGQMCVAPDYVLVHKSVKDQLVAELKKNFQEFFGSNAELSESYSRIINRKHFDRLTNLMRDGSIVFGGQTNAENLFISPTLIDNVTWNNAIMQEEIFGPLLPILTYESLDETIQTLKTQPKSLALYLFTSNPAHERSILEQVSFGGGCVNDCVLHLANSELPFGGVGLSGMGAYHGHYSFETFSHRKSIYKKLFPLDFRLEYPPHTRKKLGLLHMLLKW